MVAWARIAVKTVHLQAPASGERESDVLADQPLGDPPAAILRLPKHTTDVQLSSDGATVAVVVREPTIRFGHVIADHIGVVLVTLLILAVLLALWRTWRTRNRMRVTGEPYCRRCNYQLTAITARHCPECGVELTPRNRVIARPHRPWRRVLLIAFIAAACYGLFYLSSGTIGKWLREHGPAWHIAWLHTWAEDHDHQWLLTQTSSQAYVEVYSIDDWRQIRVIPLRVDEKSEVRLGRQARWVYVNSNDGAFRWNLATGAREVLPGHTERPTSMVGTTSDESLLVEFFSARDKNTVRLWSTSMNEENHTLEGWWELCRTDHLVRGRYAKTTLISDWLPIYSIATQKVVGRVREHLHLIAVEEDRGQVLVVTESSSEFAIEAQTMDGGDWIIRYPYPAKLSPQSFGRMARDAPLIGSSSRRAIVELQADLTVQFGHVAVGVWDEQRHEYLTTFDGPSFPLEHRFNHQRLMLSADGRRGALLGVDPLPGPVLWIYDFSNYMEK